MLDDDQLKQLLHQESLSQGSKMLLCLATDNCKPKQVKDVTATAFRAGLRAAKKWNVSSLLKSQSGKAIRVEGGWELTPDGRAFVQQIAGPLANSPAPKMAASLRALLANLKSDDIRAYVEEAIRCLELRLYRSAVVLSWVGAIALLHDYVVNHHLLAFNAEALRRDSKWKNAKTSDDLARMKEHDFLQVLESLSVIGKNVKQELEKQLKLRNACGHPNSLRIGENIVAAHIEVLTLNVYSVF